MRGDELLNKLELVDPAFLEEAEGKAPSAKRWSRGMRWAVAAAVCAALTVGSALAFSPTFRDIILSSLGFRGALCHRGVDLLRGPGHYH